MGVFEAIRVIVAAITSPFSPLCKPKNTPCHASSPKTAGSIGCSFNQIDTLIAKTVAKDQHKPPRPRRTRVAPGSLGDRIRSAVAATAQGLMTVMTRDTQQKRRVYHDAMGEYITEPTYFPRIGNGQLGDQFALHHWSLAVGDESEWEDEARDPHTWRRMRRTLAD